MKIKQKSIPHEWHPGGNGAFFQNHDGLQDASFCPWNMKSQQIWEEQKTVSSLPALSRVWTHSFHLRITPTSGTHSMDAQIHLNAPSAPPHLETLPSFKASVKVMFSCFKIKPSYSSGHELYDLLIVKPVLIKRKWGDWQHLRPLCCYWIT